MPGVVAFQRMHKGMQDRLQTDVLAQSTGAMTGKVLKRVAQLESQMQRDGAALRRVEDQLRVGQAQGLQQGVGVGVGSSADAAASAQSAAQSASNAAKVRPGTHDTWLYTSQRHNCHLPRA